MLLKTLQAFSRVSAKIDYTKDYYKELYEFLRNALLKQISQFNNSQLFVLYHPDSQTPNSEKYLNVQEAFRILSDLEYKQKYDLKRVINSGTTKQTEQQEKNDDSKQGGYIDEMSQQQFEKKVDDIWKLKITVKQGQIQYNYYFSESELKEKSINCSEFEKVVSDLITNLKLNQASIEEYKNSSFSSASVLKKVAEIAFLILAIFVSKKK